MSAGTNAAGESVVEIDDFTAMAHEVYGVRRDARWVQVEVISEVGTPRAEACFRMRLAVPADVYKSGPRKGQVNWKKRDKTLDRELIVPFARFDEFKAKRGER